MKVSAGLLAAMLLFSVLNAPLSVDAGKGIRVVGSTKDDGRILLLVQNASSNDLYGLRIESFSGVISTLDPGAGWRYGDQAAGKAKTIVVETDDNPVKSKSSMRFHIKVDPTESKPKLKFKWAGYGVDGTQIAKGAFKTINREYLDASLVTPEKQKASLCSWDGWWEYLGGSPRSYLLTAKASICNESGEPLPDARLLIEMTGPYKARGAKWITTDSEGTVTISFRVYDAGPYKLSIAKVMGKNIEYDPSNNRVSPSVYLEVKFPSE